MKFDKINNDNNCNCLEDAYQNTKDIFTRKLRRNELIEFDFQSHWERGKYINNKNCKILCQQKGISIDIIKDNNESKIIKKYQKTFKISPGRKKHYCKFKFKQNSGKMKPSRSKWHYTFYKCDQFSLNKIEIIEIKPLG